MRKKRVKVKVLTFGSNVSDEGLQGIAGELLAFFEKVSGAHLKRNLLYIFARIN